MLQGVLWHGIQNHPLIEKAKKLAEGTVLQVLYLDLIGYHQLVKAHGIPIGQQVLNSVYQFLLNKVQVNASTIVEPLWDDAFIVIAPAEYDLISWLNEYEHIPLTLSNGLRYAVSFHAGLAWIRHQANSELNFSDSLYNALTHAASIGKTHLGLIDGNLSKSFDHILNHQLITPYYQPIIAIQSGIPHGYEALSRGPEGSPLHMPGPLFDYGTRLGRLLQLEQVCRKAAISLAPIDNNERLFLNINPQTLNDPSFVKGRTKDWALTKGLKPSQIVFEITEHEAIEDYDTFRKTINHYRAQGFLIAIDDMGSGYSGLLTLVELTPDYIKLDRGLISHIDTEPSKQAMVEAMVMVAHKIGAQTIAEGIETVQELAVVSALGADYGQGFLLGRPAPIITATAATT